MRKRVVGMENETVKQFFTPFYTSCPTTLVMVKYYIL